MIRRMLVLFVSLQPAGGHLALMVACADRGAGPAGLLVRVQCVVAWCAPCDFSEGEQALPQAREAVRKFLGGPIQEKAENYRKASPLSLVSREFPPTLLCQGDSDPIVPRVQADRMAARLGEVGADVELIVVKNGDHAFGGRNAEPTYGGIVDRTFEFLARHLKWAASFPRANSTQEIAPPPPPDPDARTGGDSRSGPFPKGGEDSHLAPRPVREMRNDVAGPDGSTGSGTAGREQVGR